MALNPHQNLALVYSTVQSKMTHTPPVIINNWAAVLLIISKTGKRSKITYILHWYLIGVQPAMREIFTQPQESQGK